MIARRRNILLLLILALLSLGRLSAHAQSSCGDAFVDQSIGEDCDEGAALNGTPDPAAPAPVPCARPERRAGRPPAPATSQNHAPARARPVRRRSEERRVGKEVEAGWPRESE